MKHRGIFVLLFAILIWGCGLSQAPVQMSQDTINTAVAGTQTAITQALVNKPTPRATPTEWHLPTVTRPPASLSEAAPLLASPTIAATLPALATIPLPAPDSKLIAPGTYIVGKDIQPGLYRGATSDRCYWARLKDLTGSLDAILANDNSVGQFYVRVKPKDYALETDCRLSFLSTLPSPAAQMPAVVSPGVYLVGIDIGFGTYKGQAGNTMCYWARLSDVDGTLDSILANDNASGQYYVQVKKSDFALSTDCNLQFTGE